MTSLTRGPLPARVYWVRRVLVLGTAVLLVFGIARVLTGGSDGSSDQGSTAVLAEGVPTASDTATAPTDGETRKPKKKPKKKRTPKEPVLAQPEGDCLDEDIAVTPTVERAVAGDTVFLVLELRTVTSPACFWHVSADSLTVKITSGNDDIWSSRQCERAIPAQDVVVRQEVSTKVGIRWSGRRSDNDCTRFTDWAMPGWYHVNAAALAGEPSDLQFELARPSRPIVYEAPEPDRDRKKKDRPKPRDKHHQQEPKQR